MSIEGPSFSIPHDKWVELKTTYGVTDRDLVDMFMVPFLTEIAAHPIKFATDPRSLPERSILGEQWRILRDQLGMIYDETTMQAIPLIDKEVEELLWTNAPH